MSTFLEIALQCIARGWYVFPCVGKKPIIAKKDGGNGWHDATLDEAQIRAWWTKWPNANPAIACNPSKISVMDCDHGLRDYADLIAWRDRNGIPATYAIRTGRRDGDYGVHMYFDGPLPGVGLWQLDGCSGQIKSLDGYVMAAGCVHPDSQEKYEVIVDVHLVPVPDVVRALRTFQLPVKPNGPMDKIPEGAGRHAALTSVAGVFRNKGFDEDAILAQLIPANESMCDVPISDEDLEHIAKSVCRYPVPEPVGEVAIGKPPAPVDWRSHYHTREETENAPKPEFLIEGFLQRQAIVGLAGYVGHKKSLIAQNVAYSVCSGEPLFGCFKVSRKPSRVLYLCPEMALIGFANRVTRIGLLPYVGETFFYATMSLTNGVIKLPEITTAEAEGAVIILDTAIRFIEGDENSSQHMKELAKHAFELIRSGAEAVIVLAHSNKEMMKSSDLTLDNAMRGSSELTAFLSSCWATRLQDPEHPYESASLLKHVKPRDFEADPFEVKTDRETCRMIFVEGSRGAVVSKKVTANLDGKEEVALQVIRDNPTLSHKKLAAKLKQMGIERGASWVGNKRFDMCLGGVKTSEN